jgi:hypothetical protein
VSKELVISTAVALLTLLAGVLLSGGGHGWVAGSAGAFALAPISFFACRNAVGTVASTPVARTVLLCGLATCALVAFFTFIEGTPYFFQFFRINGVVGVVIAALTVLGWLAPSLWGLARARSLTPDR